MLPVTALSGRYYAGVGAPSDLDDSLDSDARPMSPVGRVKHDTITPTTFCATRAKMIEHAHRLGQAQALRMMERTSG